jgi:hypothetical protein
MKNTDNIEKVVQDFCAVRKSTVKTTTEMDRKIINDALAAQEKSKKTTSAKLEPNIWRTIMNNRITKFAAAAVIIIAVLIGINQFGGSVDMATIAFADITEAMKKVPWMRVSGRGFVVEAKTEEIVELWTGYEGKISAAKKANGKASFVNYNEHKRYEYDPQNNSITIHYSYEDDLPLNVSSPFSLLENWHKILEGKGAEIITKRGEYMGEEVQIQEISLSSIGQNSAGQDNVSLFVRLYIEPESKLLYADEVICTDANGNTVANAKTTYDYPPTGPADIYDLDVPRDALIIDKLPNEDYMAIRDIYRHSRTNATEQYIAVITSVSLGEFIDTVYIDFKSNRNHRLEQHSVFNPGEPVEESWPKHKKQLGDSFESLFEWSRLRYDKKGRIYMRLYDGEYSCSITKDAQGNWGELRKDYSPNFSNMRNNDLGSLGWPHTSIESNIIEDDYARENNLICIEYLQQGNIYNGNVSLPGRFLYYLDPQKNYICRKTVTEWRPDAQWQEDKDWLKDVEPEKIREGSIIEEEITEFIQAPNGYWYPKIIEERQTGIRKDYKDVPLRVNVIKTVYLRTDPEFPEGIFDPDKLPQ